MEDNEEKEKEIRVELNGNRPLSGMYEDWFLDYASYVILERAIPHVNDGLKPVQRRILHSMKDMDDGRYNKVANIIGHTMQYHPHGDAAIGDAITNLGQKDLLIDCQGNWGDVRTGDSAAAARYIEARLTKFALDVSFNKQTTSWQKSYDGRKNEPVTLPVKFPLLLAQGVEGIAVGLSTKILPHNFIELIDGSIKLLQDKTPILFPDFQTGGLVDISDYQDGRRGGRVKVRAKLEERDKNTLIIKDVPYGVTTSSLIDSIIKANDKGKIKIKKVIDNTAKDVEIEIQLPNNISTDKTIDALYAFTNCESSISPNACVIVDDKPAFLGVSDILKINTNNTVDLLQSELEIKQSELEERWHFNSLEKIFIEERIYRDIEECETWEAIISTIDDGLKPFRKLLKREITEEDIVRLTEIRIKRISRFDGFKADELMKGIQDELEEVRHNLKNLTDYAIAYYQEILKKYKANKERKTEIKDFENINTQVVAVANEKLYVNRAEGFVGTGLKKDEYVIDCSDIDDIIVFRADGTYSVSKVSQKQFFGKNINHVAVFRKNDDRMVYNAMYFDGKNKKTFAKRFSVTSLTRDKEYFITRGNADSKLLYFSANPNGEAEIVNVYLHAAAKARNKLLEYDFADLAIKGRNSKGNLVSKHRVRKTDLKEKGISTIGGRDIWYESNIGRLNIHQRGDYLGSFQTDDKILVVYSTGEYEITDHELTNHYSDKEIVIIEKFNSKKVLSAIHYDGNSKNYCVKRFLIETSTLGKRFSFITEGRGSKLVLATTWSNPTIELTTKDKDKIKKLEEINLISFIDVKGWKSIGNKLCGKEFAKAKLLPGGDEQTNDDLEPESGPEDETKETPKKNTVKETVEPKESAKSAGENKSFTSGDQINLL